MKILILGGTKFLGRHLVDAALSAGHELTLFNRGKTNPSLFPDIETIMGDREHDIEKLSGRVWEAAIDVAGYLPRIVRLSAQAVKGRVKKYVYISSLSVYADFRKVGIDETDPAGKLEDESIEEINGETYGPLKALCEKAGDVERDILHHNGGLVLFLEADRFQLAHSQSVRKTPGVAGLDVLLPWQAQTPALRRTSLARFAERGRGFQLDRRRGFLRLGVLVLRLDDRPYPTRSAAARGVDRGSDHAEKFGRLVVGDVIAADFVVAALQVRPIEELHALRLAVVLDAFSVTFHVFVDAVALLAKAGEIAVGGAVIKALDVLAHHHAIGLYTSEGCLAKYRNGSLSVWQVQPGPASTCRAMVADGSDYLWVGTDWMLYGLQTTAPVGPSELPPGIKLHVLKLDLLAPSSQGAYWRLANGRIQKFRGATLERDLGPYPWTTNAVTAACEDHEGNLVVGTYGDGVYWFDGQGGFDHIANELSHKSILTLLVDREGCLWLGTNGGGLHVIADEYARAVKGVR